MTSVNYSFTENYLKLQEIKRMKKSQVSSEILVNSNRLYWRLSELKRTTNNQDEVEILQRNIIQIEDERKMYVPMNIDEVIQCFDMCKDELPINTFRKLPCRKCSERVKNNKKPSSMSNKKHYSMNNKKLSSMKEESKVLSL